MYSQLCFSKIIRSSPLKSRFIERGRAFFHLCNFTVLWT